jgi:hypothetical protein
MDERFQFMKSIGTLPQDVQEKVDLATGVHVRRKAPIPTSRDWRQSGEGWSVVKNSEAAPLHEWKNVPAAETERGISIENRVR